MTLTWKLHLILYLKKKINVLELLSEILETSSEVGPASIGNLHQELTEHTLGSEVVHNLHCILTLA